MMVTVIDEELLAVRLQGNFDAAALQSLVRELNALERGGLFPKRIVFSEALAKVSITANDLVYYTMGRSEPSVPMQAAFVVSTEFHYGMARMFQSVLETEKKRIEIFRDLESAAQWLKADFMLLSEYARRHSPALKEAGTPGRHIQ